MSAPSSAYVIKDSNFLKAVIRKGSTLYHSYVAKFLSGAHSAGGYSTTAAAMRENIKDLFYLDGMYDLRENGTVVGFVGYVLKGGANAEFHNLDTRRSGAVLMKGAQENILLNDAGLNTLAEVQYVSPLSLFANVIVLDITVKSSFYAMTDSSQWKLTKGGTPLMLYGLGAVPARSSRTFRVGYYDASSNPTEQVSQGDTLNVNVTAVNDEGTMSLNRGISAGRRVLWEASQGRPEWHYSADEPSVLKDISTAAVSATDLYEDDLDLLEALSGIPNTVPAQAATFYKGLVRDYPQMSVPQAAGWYWSPSLALYLGDEWAMRAIYVNAQGKAQWYKQLTDPVTQLVIGLRITDAATETDRPSNTYRTFELYARTGAWHEAYPKVRVLVGVSVPVQGSVGAAYDATVITDREGNTVPHSTNIGSSLNMDAELTAASPSYSKSVTQVYSTRALMTQYGGTKYYDAGNGVYYALDRTKPWSVVCLDDDGTEHEFEGEITWEGGSIRASAETPAIPIG